MSHYGIPPGFVYNDCYGWYAPGSPADPFRKTHQCVCVEFEKFEEIEWKGWIDCENNRIPERGSD
jgi:hypothetical protein